MLKLIISVVIPAYNEELLIGKCLDSLLKQELDKHLFEVIVVDNASDDNTYLIAKKYPFRLIKEPRRSVVIARQAGVNVSRGKIIVSADADTIYPKNWLSLIKKNFDNNHKLIALVGWVYFVKTRTFFNLLFAFNQELNLFLWKVTKKFPIVYAANFAFKKYVLMKIGGYPVHLPELGDQQYLLYKFFHYGEVKIDHRLYCLTSSRKHGPVWKNILIYNGWHRLLGYVLNRLFGRQIIGPAPAIRTNHFLKNDKRNKLFHF